MLKSNRRLAINVFQAPAVEDFGTFTRLASEFGLQLIDPAETTGSDVAIRELLAGAGFDRIQVQIKADARHNYYDVTI